MSMELVTGFAGRSHVTAAQDGRRNIGTFGGGRYVLDTGQQFAITVDSANQVTVGTGDGIMDGRHVTNESPEALVVESGTQGVNRNDLVCVRYSADASTGVETASLVVVKGTATSGTPADPAINEGSVTDGDSPVDWPLWRVPVSGINVGTPVKLFEDVLPIADLWDSVSQNTAAISQLVHARLLKKVWGSKRQSLESLGTGTYYVPLGIPDGYELVGVTSVSTNHSSASAVTSFYPYGDASNAVTVKNFNSTALSDETVTVAALCAKTDSL